MTGLFQKINPSVIVFTLGEVPNSLSKYMIWTVVRLKGLRQLKPQIHNPPQAKLNYMLRIHNGVVISCKFSWVFVVSGYRLLHKAVHCTQGNKGHFSHFPRIPRYDGVPDYEKKKHQINYVSVNELAYNSVPLFTVQTQYNNRVSSVKQQFLKL